MRWIIWDGILAGVMVVLTGGVYLTGFALMVGASQTAIGILCSLPRLSQIMQPLGAFFVERLHMRKKISVGVFGPARLLWLLILLLPAMGYAGGKSRLALFVLISVAVVSSMLAGLASVSWFAWMADLIPEGGRGRFFSRRTMLAGGISATIGFVAGKGLDLSKLWLGPDSAIGFLVVFGVGMVCGLASWYALSRCPEPPIRPDPPGERPGFRAMLQDAWADRNFRQLVYALSFLTAGVWLAGPFFSVYMIREMELPYSLMSIFAACSSFGSLLMVRLWGRLSDHFGNRPVILTCLFGTGFLVVPWLLTANGAWWPLVIAHLVGGAAWSGVFLAQMNLVFKITPDEHKSVYIGIFYALINLPPLLMPVVGGLFLESTAQWAWHVGTWTFTSYHALFAMSCVLRLCSIPIFHHVREPRAKRVVHMIRVLSHFRSLNPVLGLHYYAHVASDAAANGTRLAAGAVRKTARRLRHRHNGDKVEGAD